MKPQPPVNRRAIAIFFIITGLLSLGFWWKGKDRMEDTPVTEKTGWFEPLRISFNVEPSARVKGISTETEEFVSKLKQEIDMSEGIWSVYVYRLNEKQGYGISENLVLPAASIMKVPIMVSTYQAIENGKLEQTDTIAEMLTAMGKRSDNEAPTELLNSIGRDKVRQTLKELGMLNSNLEENNVTAKDVAVMWQKLYDGELISEAHKEKMWLDLQDSIFEERIPAGVPAEIPVVHKVGSDLEVWADSGIVLSDSPFVVVVLNKDVNLIQAKDVVPRLVKMIWDHESSQ